MTNRVLLLLSATLAACWVLAASPTLAAVSLVPPQGYQTNAS